MKTLSDVYNDYKIDPYKSLHYPKSNLWRSFDTFDNIESAKEFFRKYLCYAGKSSLITNLSSRYDLSKIGKRIQHTISTYLLGSILNDKLSDILLLNDGENSFHYLWFITCLFHDIGYVFEEEKEKCDLLQLVRDCGISGFCKGLEIRQPCEAAFRTYEYQKIDLYFKMKAKCCKKIDHGIAGGILLYDGLLKALSEWRKFPKIKNQTNIRYFQDRQFIIPQNPEKLFADLSNTVISHNIYLKTLNRWNSVPDNGIGLFSPNNEPLIFILGLADTIEPLKRFCYRCDCLNHFLLNISERKISIVCNDLQNFNCASYFCNLKQMEQWLEVTVNSTETECDITIDITIN